MAWSPLWHEYPQRGPTLLILLLRVPLSERRVALRSGRGRQTRDPRVPDLEAREDHPGASRVAHLRRRRTPGPGPTTRGSRLSRRGQHRLLHEARTRRCLRRLRHRARGGRPRAAARRAGARAPVRSRPRHAADDPASPPTCTEADPSRHPAVARRDRRSGDCSQRPHGHPRHEPPRPCALCRSAVQRERAGEHGAVHVPRSAGSLRVRRLGPGRGRLGCRAAYARPAGTRSTARSAISSASCRREARSSAHAGLDTTSATTTPARSVSTIRSSACSS